MSDLIFDQQKISELSKKFNLKLLILHGSYAKGRMTPQSDIDIGVLGEHKIDKKNYFELLAGLGDVFGDKVDPAFLNNAEPMICYHVALAGKPLFESQKGAFADFKVQSIARYLDTKKFRELEKLYIKNAVGSN
jgi:predicted nucleotidyltransferase